MNWIIIYEHLVMLKFWLWNLFKFFMWIVIPRWNSLLQLKSLELRSINSTNIKINKRMNALVVSWIQLFEKSLYCWNYNIRTQTITSFLNDSVPSEKKRNGFENNVLQFGGNFENSSYWIRHWAYKFIHFHVISVLVMHFFNYPNQLYKTFIASSRSSVTRFIFLLFFLMVRSSTISFSSSPSGIKPWGGSVSFRIFQTTKKNYVTWLNDLLFWYCPFFIQSIILFHY